MNFLTEQADRLAVFRGSQLLKSGTSIGANIKESQQGQSKADFYAKLSISLKEASKTEYWLELLHESGYIGEEEFSAIYKTAKKSSKSSSL